MFMWDAAATCVVTTESAIENEKFRRDLEYARQVLHILLAEVMYDFSDDYQAKIEC